MRLSTMTYFNKMAIKRPVECVIISRQMFSPRNLFSFGKYPAQRSIFFPKKFEKIGRKPDHVISLFENPFLFDMHIKYLIIPGLD